MSALQRLRTFFSKQAVDPAVAEIYRACIRSARQTVFFERLCIPDTVDGRFDMLLLHVLLVMRRLTDVPDARQALFDLMFADMDVSLREMGVGDMGIGRRIKPMIQAFYGRGEAYEAALAGTDLDLQLALHRNLYANMPVPDGSLSEMVAYVRATVEGLDAQSSADLLSGRLKLISLS